MEQSRIRAPQRGVIKSWSPTINANATDQVYALLRERLTDHPQLELPPRCFTEMQAEVLDYRDDEHLIVRFPVRAEYRNPLGFMQGGFIAAALDNTIGPFSYLSAPPSVTTQLVLNYLRPIPPNLTEVVCTARLLERAGKTIIYQGSASADAKVVALAQATTQLV